MNNLAEIRTGDKTDAERYVSFEKTVAIIAVQVTNIV